MPQNAGGDRAPGGPGSGHTRELFRVGKATELLDLLCGSGQCQITLRPDIGPAKSHKEIDVCGPRTHAGKLQQDGTDCLITQPGKGSEVERAGKESSGQRVAVGCLLSGEPGSPEAGFDGGRHMTRGNSTGDALEATISGLGRREGDLLLKNDTNQRGKAWASGPQWWWSKSPDDTSKITIACRELANASKERSLGESSRRVPQRQSRHDLP